MNKKPSFWCLALLSCVGASPRQATSFAMPPLQAVAGEVARLEVLTRPDVWLDASGDPLPFQDEDSILEFLQSASVISDEVLEQGINQSRKMLLEKDGVRLNAVFRDVRVRKPETKFSDGSVKRNFRDDFVFEVAAYRLAKMLGLHNIPPTVERRIKGRKGSLQIWVEEVMTEGNRVEKDITPPDSREWLLQWQIVRLFDNLIFNDDRNPGNTLIDTGWKLWMIDHTRAFGDSNATLNENLVIRCEREVWNRLRALSRDTLKAELRGLLEGRQLNALLARRDRLVEYVGRRVERLGEEEVFF